MNLVDKQLEDLKRRYEGATFRILPSGTRIVTVPHITLISGWNKSQTTVRFLIPSAYPYAALDCFWADNDLRLANNQLPQASGADREIPEANETGLWFSWHLTQPWNPNRDTLSSWMNTVNDRLLRVQ